MDYWQPLERIAAIDGDLLVYAAASKFNEEETNEKALAYIDNEIRFHNDVLGLDDFIIYTTAGGNFRKDITPTYKANRVDRERPKYLIDCYRYLFEEWKSVSKRGYEADDLLCIAITSNPDWLLVSYDKDFKQVPGWRYDWRKYEISYTTSDEANYFLAKQMLEGDRSDNIQGVYGIGPKKAQRILEEAGQTFRELFTKVLSVYKDNDLSKDTFIQNYQLLKLLTTEEIAWPELEFLND